MKGLDLLTFTNTLVIVYHRTAPIMSLQRAKGEQPGPGGMLRNASESVNQADTKVSKKNPLKTYKYGRRFESSHKENEQSEIQFNGWSFFFLVNV